jgi:hypothetical protein
MPFDSYQNACGGTQTANIVVQSFFNPTPSTAGFPTATAEWGGSSWTAGPSISTARRDAFSSKGGAAQTATFLAGGGAPGPVKNNTELYDGTSWTSVGNINTARLRGGGGGSSTAGIIVAGSADPPRTTATESWDGSSWTTNPFSTAVATDTQGSAFATNTNGITFGGSTDSGTTAAAEELNTSINTISAGAWTSSTVYPTPNSYLAGFGVLNAGVAAGGDGPPGNGITTTAEYDGSSWTAGGALGTGRRGLGSGTNSTLTAGLVFGGNDPGVPTQYALVEEYNGSSWSEVTNLPGNQSNVGGFGTQTAGACLPVSATATLEYDGTNWTSGGPLSTPRSNTLGIGCGTLTAGLCIGGGPSGPVAGDTEEYNGTAWTAGGDYFRAIQFQGSAGIQTSALISGGGPGSNTDCGGYDGTSFSTRPSMSTGREAHCGGIGSATNTTGLAVTGRTPPRSNAVEEFTGATETATASTLTTS